MASGIRIGIGAIGIRNGNAPAVPAVGIRRLDIDKLGRRWRRGEPSVTVPLR